MKRVSFSPWRSPVMFGFLTGFAVIRRSVLILERGPSFVQLYSIMHKQQVLGYLLSSRTDLACRPFQALFWCHLFKTSTAMGPTNTEASRVLIVI